MRCPHCNSPLKYDEVYAWFAEHSRVSLFDHDCPHCHRTIFINVTTRPVFSLAAPINTTFDASRSLNT